MSKEKACLNCKIIFGETSCPICGETSFTDSWKGRIYIFNSDKSEVAQNMKINKTGLFAIKTK